MIDVMYEQPVPGEKPLKKSGLFKSQKAYQEWKAKHPDNVILEIIKTTKKSWRQ